MIRIRNIEDWKKVEERLEELKTKRKDGRKKEAKEQDVDFECKQEGD